MVGRPIVVLIAEDEPGHAVLVERNLRRAGFVNEIHHFGDGQQILDFLFGQVDKAHDQIDCQFLLLLDIRMPKVDGTEVLRQVRADDRLRSTPCVMLTTTDDPREVEKCQRLGCSHYIVKPLSADRFVETIRRLGLSLSIVALPPGEE